MELERLLIEIWSQDTFWVVQKHKTGFSLFNTKNGRAVVGNALLDVVLTVWHHYYTASRELEWEKIERFVSTSNNYRRKHDTHRY